MGAVKKIVDKANSNVNKVMGVVDPVGAYLKEKTETQSQKDVMKLLGGLFGSGGNVGSGNSDVASESKAVAEEAVTSVKARREQRGAQRRQGAGSGSTLLMTEDDTRLQGSTLLGE